MFTLAFFNTTLSVVHAEGSPARHHHQLWNLPSLWTESPVYDLYQWYNTLSLSCMAFPPPPPPPTITSCVTFLTQKRSETFVFPSVDHHPLLPQLSSSPPLFLPRTAQMLYSDHVVWGGSVPVFPPTLTASPTPSPPPRGRSGPVITSKVRGQCLSFSYWYPRYCLCATISSLIKVTWKCSLFITYYCTVLYTCICYSLWYTVYCRTV